ncbi:MAG: heme exporter protein CcmD [Candidatus Wenzhouxiangella sp. M2_3B_020]
MIPDISHAQYVWTSYAIFALIVGWQFVQPLVRRKKLVANMIEAEAERRAAERSRR